MKKNIVLIILILSFIITLSSCNTSKKEDIDTLNECYNAVVDCYNNGFKNAEININAFEEVLNKELYYSAYKKSDFYNEPFFFNSINYKTDSKSFKKERCKDTVIAVYLAYSLKNTPDNFSNDFIKYYTTIDFSFSSSSEFQALLCNNYDLTEEELKIVMKAFDELSEKCSDKNDILFTLKSEEAIIADYNKKNPTSKVKMDETVSEEYKAVLEYFKNNSSELEVIWNGYENLKNVPLSSLG